MQQLSMVELVFTWWPSYITEYLPQSSIVVYALPVKDQSIILMIPDSTIDIWLSGLIFTGMPVPAGLDALSSNYVVGNISSTSDILLYIQ